MAFEVMTVDEGRKADAAAIAAGTPGLVLMQRAGQAVADAILERYTPRRVVVLCGPGSNGGDGYVAALRLNGAGFAVRVAAMPLQAGGSDAAACARAWTQPLQPLDAKAIEDSELVVDALFGAGLKRPLSADVAAVLQAANDQGKPLVAVDLPSGLDGDTGAPLGYAPSAALTVTFHRKKLAHVLQPGRALCGEVVVADIGLEQGPFSSLHENTPELWAQAFPRLAVGAYKTKRGHLMVVGGGPSQTGAARLASRAGLRVGAGLVTLLSPPASILVNAAHLEAVMLKAVKDPDALLEAAAAANVVVIGPAAGVGSRTRDNLLALKNRGARKLIVDADALTSFKDDPQTLFAALRAGDVMTPHPGEFERVFPELLKIGPERVTAARTAARQAGAVVLLKGPDTVIAAPDGRGAVNTNASPWLATAGSGDVLAGLIGGLAAQGMESFLAACAGAWIHGAAGSLYGPGLIAEDLPGLVPEIIKQIYHQRNWL